MVINFLVWTLKCTETLINFVFVLFTKDMKNNTLKKEYYSKTAEIFCTALTDQSAEKKYKIHLSLHITWDIYLWQWLLKP